MWSLMIASVFGLVAGFPVDAPQQVLDDSSPILNHAAKVEGSTTDAPSRVTVTQGNYSFISNSTFNTIPLDGIANKTLLDDGLLSFERWHVVNSTAATDQGYLAAADLGCVWSAPNFLLSRPPALPAMGHSFFQSNATALAARNLSEFFDVHRIGIKPVGFLPPEPRVYVVAWEIVDGEARNFYSYHANWLTTTPKPGYVQFAIDANFLKSFPGWGARVNVVEMYGVDPQGEPIDFCVDNIVLGFHAAE